MNNQLIEDNIQLVRGVISQYYPWLHDDEDMFQIGCIGLCKAADGYDESKGSFSTIAYICIQNAIKTELRRRMREIPMLSLDAPSFRDNEEFSLMDTLIGSKDVEYIDLADIMKDFTPREKQIIKLVAQGMTVCEVSKVIGRSRETVSKAIRKFKKLVNASKEVNQ